MGFVEAVQSGFSNYVNFQGRAIRSEYWYWVLFVIILAVIAQIIDYVIGMHVIYPICMLAVLLPGLGVSVRRLHDLDRSGWWLLLSFIPLVGAIVLIYWDCQPGTAGDNKFGPNPSTGSPQLAARRAI
jgi:uncharacterized membrane protein YhaH (DUF805 family)